MKMFISCILKSFKPLSFPNFQLVPKYYLIIGNHTCANRGDAAILRGLLNSLRTIFPDSYLAIMSRYPMAGKFILNEEMVEDFVHSENIKPSSVIKKIRKRLSFEFLLYSLQFPGLTPFVKLLMTTAQKKYCEYIKTFDAIIQVGGSFFVDLYGIGQFENVLLTIYSGKDIHLLGHSLGPFEKKKFKRFSKLILPRIKEIKIRDTESLRLLREANMFFPNMSNGADTAWLIGRNSIEAAHLHEFSTILTENSNVIAITLRDLFPFGKRLGISQDKYEALFVELIERLILWGAHIVCVSMCTGLDSYQKDDRMVGLRIKYKIKEPAKMTVLMGEYTDVEIGQMLSQCRLLIGTRLHSVILSLLFNTPAIAILYEHKSKGVLEKLQLGGLSFFINEMSNSTFFNKILDVLENNEIIRDEIEEKVSNEIRNGWDMIKSISFN